MIVIVDQYVFLMLLGDQIYCFYQCVEKSIRNVYYYYVNGIVNLSCQCLGIGVWLIIQFIYGFYYCFMCVGIDQCVVIEYLGNCCYRDVSLMCYIMNGDYIYYLL